MSLGKTLAIVPLKEEASHSVVLLPHNENATAICVVAGKSHELSNQENLPGPGCVIADSFAYGVDVSRRTERSD